MSLDLAAKFIDQFSGPFRSSVKKGEAAVSGLESKAKTTSSNMGNAFKSAASFLAPLGIAAGATLAVKKVFDLTKETATYRDEITKMSRATGVSVDVLSGLGFAAERSGAHIDSVGKAFGRLARNINEASRTEGAARGAFNQLGVQFDDGTGKLRGLYDVLLDTADAFTRIDDSTRKAAIAQELFGRSGVELVPLLNEGKAGITSLREEAERLGITFDQSAGEQAEKAVDAMTNFNTAVQGLNQQFTSKFIPSLTSAATLLSNIIALLNTDLSKSDNAIVSWLFTQPEFRTSLDDAADTTKRVKTETDSLIESLVKQKKESVAADLERQAAAHERIVAAIVARQQVIGRFPEIQALDPASVRGDFSRAPSVPVPEVPTELPEDIHNIRDYFVEIGEYTDEWNDSILDATGSVELSTLSTELLSLSVSTVGQGLAQAVVYSENLKDALEAVAKQLASRALSGFFGLVAGSIIGGLTGGPAGALAGAIRGAEIGSGINFGTRQHGGPVIGGRPYLVGEGGPEIFVPGRNGQIIPNRQINNSPSITIVINHYGPNLDENMIQTKLIPAVSKAVRSGNAELLATSVKRA